MTKPTEQQVLEAKVAKLGVVDANNHYIEDVTNMTVYVEFPKGSVKHLFSVNIKTGLVLQETGNRRPVMHDCAEATKMAKEAFLAAQDEVPELKGKHMKFQCEEEEEE